MMYTMPKNLLTICVNFALATQPCSCISLRGALRSPCLEAIYNGEKALYDGARTVRCALSFARI